ncbi:MAG: hypothetical protein JWO30_648 [Fibrobacteres bacterium]|nr:hypothetical protein [Fibrobacterota bacterium]
MSPKKSATESGIGAVASGEEAILRSRVAELEAELQRLRKAVTGVDAALPAREALLSEAEKVAHLGSWFMNPQTNEVKWSEELYRILGYDPAKDSPTAEKFFQAIHPDDLQRSLKNGETLSNTGQLNPIDLRIVWKDGTIREVRSEGTVIRDEDGKPFRVVGTVLDVTETRKAEREAKRIARFLKEAQSVAHVGSWVWETATGNLDWSNELRQIFGLSPDAVIDAKSFISMIHPEDRSKVPQNLEELLEKGFGGPVELRIIRPDGTLRHTLVQSKRMEDDIGGVQRFLGTVWDITERKQLEEQLRQSQKMEVVGRVAGGVAHDFNNLLTVISGNADLILEDHDDDRLRRIRDAADVGAALTRQLLAFSRQAVVKPAALDLNVAIRDIVRIVDRLIGEDISIKLELASDPAVILADGAQVQQILLNLAVNARDAMGNGGELTFSTRQAPGNPLNVGSEPARWVELKVRDTGKGMDSVTRERAFEPFFTTKEPGKGTGLGLSTIADIVTQMKGTIAIASEPNRGTLVTIRFPHSAIKVAAPPPVELKSRKGRESILLVEDNAELRELVRLFLTSAGYKVQAVGRPGEAESMWKTEKDTIDLLITDMVMPEKNGKDLAKALLAMKPGLKTLFISGYSPSRNGFGEWGFLQKPFTRNELLDSVRALCDGKTPSPPHP